MTATAAAAGGLAWLQQGPTGVHVAAATPPLPSRAAVAKTLAERLGEVLATLPNDSAKTVCSAMLKSLNETQTERMFMLLARMLVAVPGSKRHSESSGVATWNTARGDDFIHRMRRLLLCEFVLQAILGKRDVPSGVLPASSDQTDSCVVLALASPAASLSSLNCFNREIQVRGISLTARTHQRGPMQQASVSSQTYGVIENTPSISA
eukprot:SAG31_NODE_5_length_43735_cov_42.922266_14_plen_208_part_00